MTRAAGEEGLGEGWVGPYGGQLTGILSAAYHNSGPSLQGMAPSHCKVSDLTLFKYPVYWLKANSDRESKVVSRGSCFRKGKLQTFEGSGKQGPLPHHHRGQVQGGYFPNQQEWHG